MSNYTQIERDGLYELTDSARAELKTSSYYNDDLAPTTLSQRTWSTYNIASLWVGMSVCIPSFTMASGLVAMGLNPWMAVLNVTLGNLIILIPMQLNSHAGTKYGIPFPVFCRETFGAIGAHIPALSRGLTACGWCAIQSWIGGGAIAAIIGVFSVSYANWAHISFVGAMVSPGQLIGFLIFLVLVLIIAIKGSEAIKLLQSISAPIIMALCLALLVWSFVLATNAGYSISDVFRAKTDTALLGQFGGGLFVFLGGLTANIAFWATMALNIPDFSRYATNQKAQFRGQLL
ncbi:MAG: cytosine permease, partial [Clostridiales bacterium]|nr:cytosine permease [Clostridiales bacterium]